MELCLKICGVLHTYEVKNMMMEEPDLTDGNYELLATVVEKDQPFPQEVKLLILISSPDVIKVRKMEILINERGGVSSDEEFREILREVCRG